MKKLVIFDLDGTLNQTMLYGVDAVRQALEALGADHFTDAEIRAQFGARPADYARYYFPDAGEALRREFLRLEAEAEDRLIETRGRAFDGARESLEALRRDGYLLAVCSNASARYIGRVLRVIGLDDLVDEIQPLMPGLIKEQTLRLLLERLRPGRAVMAGDRVYDWEAARANGLPFIGCAYGYNPEEILGADRVAQNAGELYRLAAELIG